MNAHVCAFALPTASDDTEIPAALACSVVAQTSRRSSRARGLYADVPDFAAADSIDAPHGCLQPS